MAKYAEGTTVSVENSQIEVKRVCVKYGAAGVTLGDDGRTGGGVEFEMNGRRLRFVVRYPDPKAKEFTHISPWKERTKAQAQARWDAEIRRLWRVLLVTLKGKLEAVENGLVSFEEEMLGYIVVPGMNRTIGEMLVPQLDEVYRTRSLPPLLGAGTGG
jgi:hypothetical protein